MIYFCHFKVGMGTLRFPTLGEHFLPFILHCESKCKNESDLPFKVQENRNGAFKNICPVSKRRFLKRVFQFTKYF